MPFSTPTYWTADLVRALSDDGQRHELAHGELLVTPAPTLAHQRVLARLYDAIREWLHHEPVGEILWSPADLSPAPDTLLQPDLFVLPARPPVSARRDEIRDLILVTEVLSPATARHDRFQKRRVFQEWGVPLYWIVDLDARQVEVWTPADRFPRLERESLRWQPEGCRTAFTLDLPALFAAG